jgi:hypothetical protein
MRRRVQGRRHGLGRHDDERHYVQGQAVREIRLELEVAELYDVSAEQHLCVGLAERSGVVSM